MVSTCKVGIFSTVLVRPVIHNAGMSESEFITFSSPLSNMSMFTITRSMLAVLQCNLSVSKEDLVECCQAGYE